MSTASPPVQLHRAPHIERSIDNTALAMYMECPRKFFYAMIASRRKRGPTRPALAYGSCWHKILEMHYRTGGDSDQVYAAAVRAWEPHDDPEDHRTFQRCWSEYENYLDHWGSHDDEAKHWGHTVGYPEQPIVEQPVELSWPGAFHPYAGKIDRIVEHEGLFLVEDHKTTKQLGPGYFRQWDPSNQMMGYAWLAQKLTGLPIAGVRINVHAVLKQSSKFQREVIHISQPRLDEWTRNYNHWAVQINNALAQYNTLCERLDPMEALLHTFPHNFNACAGKYSACTYVDVCTFSPQSREAILASEFDFFPWDPMAELEDE